MAEYNKRKVFAVNPLRLSSGDYTTYRWRQSLLPLDDAIQDNTASANPNAWIFDRNSGAITQQPKMSASNLAYNGMEPNLLGNPYQNRSGFTCASRRPLKNQDILNLFMQIASLLGPGELKTDTFPNPNGGQGGYGFSMVCGVVNTDEGEISGSSYIPNYWGCLDGQPMQQSTLEQYYTAQMYGTGPQGTWFYNSPHRVPSACPIAASPYSWPMESFRGGKQAYSRGSMYYSAAQLIKDLNLDITSKAYSQGGPSMILRACYLLLQKMTKFFSVWRVGQVQVANFKTVFRTAVSTTQNPDISWNLFSGGSYIGSPDSFGFGFPTWGYGASSVCESYYNWDNPTLWFHTQYHMKSIMYHLFNPTPWSCAIDIYAKTAWAKSDLSDFQSYISAGEIGYNYKYATDLYPSAEFGKYAQWSDLSATIGARSSGYGIWNIDKVLDCPLPSIWSDPANELCLPPISSIVAVYTPDFS